VKAERRHHLMRDFSGIFPHQAKLLFTFARPPFRLEIFFFQGTERVPKEGPSTPGKKRLKRVSGLSSVFSSKGRSAHVLDPVKLPVRGGRFRAGWPGERSRKKWGGGGGGGGTFARFKGRGRFHGDCFEKRGQLKGLGSRPDLRFLRAGAGTGRFYLPGRCFAEILCSV